MDEIEYLSPELKKRLDLIQQYSDKLASIESNSCQELQDELKRLEHEKLTQLHEVSQMRKNELNKCHQETKDFYNYLLNELQRIRADIQS